MTRRSRLLALALSVGLAAGAYQLVTPAAGAAYKYTALDKTTVGANDRNWQSTGRADIAATVTWYDDKQSFFILGWLDDLCDSRGNGDGYGAYFSGTIVFMDGTRIPLRFTDGSTEEKDEQGCPARSAGVSSDMGWLGKNVKQLNVALRERNDAGRLGQTILWSVDNPLTGPG